MRLNQWLAEALRRPTGKGMGRIIRLEDSPDGEAARLVARMTAINKISQRTLGPEDVHIRGMNVCNDVIDYYESRFTVKGLRQVARLIPGSSMARGHDMTSPPLAAVFDGDVLTNEAGSRARELRDLSLASWARGLFYIPRAMSHAADLVEAIDTGLEREVSLHWNFERATCSICDQDIRSCEHMPGEAYDTKDGKSARCFYEMEDVTDILETSFVLKGGQRGTSLWGVGEAGRSLPSFGAAIRDAKCDRDAWHEWTRSFAPSVKNEKPTGQSAVRWFGGAFPRT